jgi:hypothetical protein
VQFSAGCTTSTRGRGLPHEKTDNHAHQIAAWLAHRLRSGAPSCPSSREQNPFDFSRFEGWFAGVEHRALKLGDYSIAGLEDICVVERKDLADLVHSFTATRSVFVDRLKRMTTYPHRLLVVTAALSQVKSAYPQGRANPNRIFQSLIALLAGFNIPFLCTETHELGEEAVASYLYHVHLYHWLETNDYGRFLADQDL